MYVYQYVCSHYWLQWAHMRLIYWFVVSYMHISNWYMWHLRGIFVSGTYLVTMCKVVVAVGCISVYMGKHVDSVCPFSIMALWLIFAMWQSHLCCHESRGMIWNTIQRMDKKPCTLIVQVSCRQSFNDLIWSLYSKDGLEKAVSQ